MNLEETARKLAEKANECCYRTDGFQEDMEKVILIALKEAYEYGFLVCDEVWNVDAGE